MPKILSLKKAQPNAPPKNQKAITQFFTNFNVPATQKPQSSNVECQTSSQKCTEKRTAKRKAFDKIETIVITDEIGSSVASGSTYKNGAHSPKKYKADHMSSFRSSNQAKDHLAKENSSSVQCSPSKCNNKISQPLEVCINKCIDEDDVEHKSKRSPLTPVKNNNALGNHDFSENGRINSPPILIEDELCVKNNRKVVTPKKVLLFEDQSACSPGKKNRTPNKSPLQELRRSPRIAKLKTPEKLTKEVLSPSKSGSTVKVLDFSDHRIDDVFGDEWGMGDIDEKENGIETLDLSTMQRCEVTSVTRHPGRLELRLKNANDERATCFVEGVWIDTPLSPGEIVSVLATRDPSGHFCVGNTAGLLALRPDHLVSSTSVVAGVFCKRKALLQERWKGLDSANTAMTTGILIHELVQKALTQRIMEPPLLRAVTENIIKQSIQMLYDAGLSEEEARTNLYAYIPPLADFMQKYMSGLPAVGKQEKDQWNGHIEKVLDIEENMCCPQLGLKGKIDATLQVTIHERKGRRRTIVPLELKSGKASVSAEHRGQLVQYGMMLCVQRGQDPAREPQPGLLLYLKERVDLREVSCGYPERRDLVMLRNQLVQHLAVGPDDVDPEQLADIEDASCLLQQRLPEPVHHQNACTKCPYLTICSLHLWHTDGPSVSDSHPLSLLRGQALGHLSPAHIQYFLRWTALLRMEERGQAVASPLHSLWTDSVDKRSKRGTCAAHLKLKSVEPSGDRYIHKFMRKLSEDYLPSNAGKPRGPQEGEFSIVSIDKRPWIAAGVVLLADDKEINIVLERDLSNRLAKDTAFHIDTYESYATTVQNLTNLGVLLEDSDRAERLRKLIIDKQTPEFEKKLPREVGRLGSKLMRSLNIEQQRAVLKALSAKDYVLFQGLPGTGKTQTISVLIQMLVALEQRVLVTAHTHSAVDNVLSRLPATMRVMRLGPSSRVAASVASRCEQRLTAGCETPKQLEELYETIDVVGVTCLGAAHAMLARTAFNICIVDEATQVLQPTVLRPLLAASRFVLVGDPAQLPPVVRSRAARRLGMEESLFYRLMSEDVTCTLRLQYRMNQALADVANRVAYNSRLKCADQGVASARLDIDVKKLSAYTEAPWLTTACSPEPEDAAIFIDMEVDAPQEGKDKSCANLDEACLVVALVDALIAGGVKPSDTGVIAPYRDQVALLRIALGRRGVEASTVDQFQGRDKSVIMFSACKRHNEHTSIKEGEILNDQRRLAVSVTRAKHKLLVVGDSRALLRYAPLQRLVHACKHIKLNQVVINTVQRYRTEFS